ATFATIDKLESGGKYLFISTSEVYSGLPKPPYKENQIGTTNTDHPRSCYIEGKRGGEAIVNAYRARGVSAKSARLALAYGPGTRKDDARVLNNFIQKALTKGKIELMDSGISPRTYLYVADAVEILFDILFKGSDGLYNVGGTSRTTIAKLAKLVGKNTKTPVIIPKDKVGLSGAPTDVRLDMTKAKKEFGKTNFIPLEEGLRRTIDWQRKLY
ncbi:MAG: NAD-dependent epimerase/dehydratase family protein, partial [Candidatus Moraniibacteriota bacterium]